MSGAVIVLVLIATTDAHAPATESMLRAARAALGDSTSLDVREVASPPDDDRAVAIAVSAHAAALAEVTWGDAKHLVARVRVHVDGAGRWSDRKLGFEAGDEEAERGRTVGFTLASMLPERTDSPLAPTPAVPPAPSSSTAPTPSAPPSTSAPPAVRDGSPPTPELGPPSSRDAPLGPAPGVEHGSLDAAAIAGFGFGGEAGGIGASVAGRWNVSAPFALRLSAGLRAGDVDVAAATSKTYVLGLGTAWRMALPGSRRWGIGARTDFLVIREELSHFDFDDATPVSAARWVPGADLLTEGYWRFTDSTSVFVGAGVEVAFGATDVLLAGARVTTIPPFRGVGELGIRARF